MQETARFSLRETARSSPSQASRRLLGASASTKPALSDESGAFGRKPMEVYRGLLTIAIVRYIVRNFCSFRHNFRYRSPTNLK